MKQTICSVGDTIFHDGFPAGYDLDPIRNVVEQADVRLFNLEIVVSDRALFGSTYLCDRNRQFGTALRLNGNVMEVALT